MIMRTLHCILAHEPAESTVLTNCNELRKKNSFRGRRQQAVCENFLLILWPLTFIRRKSGFFDGRIVSTERRLYATM